MGVFWAVHVWCMVVTGHVWWPGGLSAHGGVQGWLSTHEEVLEKWLLVIIGLH